MLKSVHNIYKIYKILKRFCRHCFAQVVNLRVSKENPYLFDPVLQTICLCRWSRVCLRIEVFLVLLTLYPKLCVSEFSVLNWPNLTKPSIFFIDNHVPNESPERSCRQINKFVIVPQINEQINIFWLPYESIIGYIKFLCFSIKNGTQVS